MEHTSKVHLYFRGAAEVARKLRQASLLCELGAAGVALYTILAKPTTTAVWLPAGILGLTLFGTVLRSYSSKANGFSHRCRRISLRAFCEGKNVDTLTVSTLDDDTPPMVEWLANSMPAKGLEEYYEPTMPHGTKRLVELYAHSAFYTWRLLRIQAIATFLIGLAVLIGCVAVIYHLAVEPTVQTDRKAVLEAICTVVLLVVTAKAFHASWEAYSSYEQVRAIENALLNQPSGETLIDLIDSYEIERAAGANPSGWIYRLRRRVLSAKWNERRKAFVQAVS